MTAAGGDPGETPPNGDTDPGFPAYGPAPDPAYGMPMDPAYGPPSYGTPPVPPPAYPAPPPPPYYPPPPPYGAPYPVGYGYPGYPPPQPGTNALAVTSLICSILGLIPICGFLFSVVGIVTGAVGLSQVKRTGQQGYGLAVAGLVVGVLTALIWLIGFISFSRG